MENQILEILMEMQKDIKEMKEQLNRIETQGNDDVVAMLKTMVK